MGYYVGLDVSLKATRICVVDESGRAVRERWFLSGSRRDRLRRGFIGP